MIQLGLIDCRSTWLVHVLFLFLEEDLTNIVSG